MKIKFVLLACFISIGSANLAQVDRENLNNDCIYVNMTLNNSKNLLDSFRFDKFSRGPFSVHPFTIDNIGSWNNFISSIKTDPNISFEYVDSEESRMFEGSYHRYQQYYKGVLVEGGGFKVFTNTTNIQAIQGPPCPGCPPIHPCDLIEMISPHIYENINISANPSVNQNELYYILDVPPLSINKITKQVVNLGDNSCTYRLIWSVNYNDNRGEPLNAKIDANSGDIIYQTPLKLYKNAPIKINASNGSISCAVLNDMNIGNTTFLKNNKIKVVDLDVEDRFVTWLDNDVPFSPIDRAWNCIVGSCGPGNCLDASVPAFELFYNADLIVQYLSEHFNINLTNVNLAFNKQTDNAYLNLEGGTVANLNSSFLVFGIDNITNQPYTNFEFVAHELAHVILMDYLNFSTISSASLHEGLADIFSIFLQHKALGYYNWVMGEGVISPVRNLANTPFNCVSSFTNSTEMHDAGQALGHWYFLLVTGSPVNNISSINQDILFDVILESLKSLGTQTPNWNDLMRATLAIAEKKFGTCSSNYQSIARAWEKICVPTGVPSAVNYNAPCTSIEGPNIVCEESDKFDLCIASNAGINFDNGDWIILGPNSTSFTSLRGMAGNTQYGGGCLVITDIPKFPFYPQTITVLYRNNQIGKTISKTIRIIDCNRDDPTCSDYYGFSIPVKSPPDSEELFIKNEHILEVESGHLKPDDEVKIIIFDLMGNKINNADDHLTDVKTDYPQILILTYWNKKGKLVRSRKVIKF